MKDILQIPLPSTDIVTLRTAIRQPSKVVFVHTIGDGLNVDVKMSFGMDGRQWSEYKNMDASLTDLRMSYGTTGTSGFYVADYFLRFRIEVSRTAKPEENTWYRLTSINIDGHNYGSSDVTIRKIDNGNKLNLTVGGTLFDPYRSLENAHEIRSQLSKVVTLSTGHLCQYFRRKPKEGTLDTTMRAYRAFEVYDMKEMKITFVDGKKPSSEPVFVDDEVYYEENFKIEINKQVFMDTFASGTPMVGDYIYLYMDCRPYILDSVFEDRDMMNRSIHYIATLTKYEEKAINDSSAFSADIDGTEGFAKYLDQTDAATILDEELDAIGDYDSVIGGYYDTETLQPNDSPTVYKKFDVVSLGSHITSVKYLTENVTYRGSVIIDNMYAIKADTETTGTSKKPVYTDRRAVTYSLSEGLEEKAYSMSFFVKTGDTKNSQGNANFRKDFQTMLCDSLLKNGNRCFSICIDGNTGNPMVLNWFGTSVQTMALPMALKPSSIYGFHINRNIVTTDQRRTTTFSVYRYDNTNHIFTLEQSLPFAENFPVELPISLSFHGIAQGLASWSNIRMKKTASSKADMLTNMITFDTKSADWVFIDNVEQGWKSEKVKSAV